MKNQILVFALLFLGMNSVFAHEEGGMPHHASPPGARVFIIEPADGATVHNPVKVKFGLEGMMIAPAGPTGGENTGHHHLLIDLEALPPLDRPLPSSEQIRHFGQGETEASLTLTPGWHYFRLLLADGNHIPHNPPVMSDVVHINVQ
ncbi:MAG: DUF4399 domain-containing protein [Deltaproteobacteria bacterium]|nr:DUF4399 domain-containing protein [Deltaproteobacteria bacterium]